MITASELAGFFAAQAMVSLSAGEPLAPMLAFTTEDGSRKMTRFDDEDLEAAVELARERLLGNAMGATDAVLLFDGLITPEGEEELDAIVIEMRAFHAPSAEAILAVPYTPKESGRFVIHRPRVLAWENCEDFDVEIAFAAFFQNVQEHAEGAAVWAAAFDESK